MENHAPLQTGIDGLRLIADHRPLCPGPRVTVHLRWTAGALLTATAYVKKFTGCARVAREIAARRRTMTNMCSARSRVKPKMWAEKPRHYAGQMQAEALALRRAFPAEMGGLYTADG